MPHPKGITSLSASQMAGRICGREDNVYDKRVIKHILDMCADECRKAILDGERIQISRVGTIIPEVKVHIGNFNLPGYEQEGDSQPFTGIRIFRNHSLREAMNGRLTKNIQDGIYGLARLPFGRKQMDILRHSGYIPQESEDGESAI